MDILLGKVTQQAMNYAIRSGITITSGYAIRQCARLLKTTPRGSGREELASLQIRLESKIRIISPAIDMIELIAARGNTSLESAVTLTKDLRWEIQALGVHLANAANEEELLLRRSSKAKSREQTELELKLVIADIRKLLDRIEDAVPLINLAITTSGVSLSTNLPATVSPSRLLQASTFLTAGDRQYTTNATQSLQIGPAYTLSMYMLFAGHTWRPHDEDGIRETTWKEVIHKARVKLMRVPLDELYDLPGETGSHAEHGGSLPRSIRGEARSLEFAYHLLIIEDLEDDRVHTFEDDEPQPGPYEGVALAGIRDVLPIHEVSKIFYADTGKILNIGSEGETNNPILLLKRDIDAEPPRRMTERQQNEEVEWTQVGHAGGDAAFTESNGHYEDPEEQSELDAQIRRESFVHLPEESNDQKPMTPSSARRLPPGLDPEWIAFEVYSEEPDSEPEEDPHVADSDVTSSRPTPSCQGSLESNLVSALACLDLRSPSPTFPSRSPRRADKLLAPVGQLAKPPSALAAAGGGLKTPLSLLEMLIRLTALQQFRQTSHLAIEDELLNFFLDDSSTTGAGPNAEYRQRVRRDARRRVGFDPYDESPIKRRGEEYLAHQHGTPHGDVDVERKYGDRTRYVRSASPGTQNSGGATPEYIRPSIEHLHAGRSPSVPSSPSPLRLQNRPLTRSSPVPGTPYKERHHAPFLATPPGTTRSRPAFPHNQAERKPRSPLGACRFNLEKYELRGSEDNGRIK
ncbi:Ran-specific GTPase-activating protein 30 [Elasticomyces elasticus]|nr:Ran-specific GTPase-activating protein 30 [Elasticomyces elasticus]